MAIEVRRDPSNIDGAMVWADEGPSFQSVVDLQVREGRHMREALNRMDTEGGIDYKPADSSKDPRSIFKPSEVGLVNRVEAAAKLVVSGEGATPRRMVEPEMMAIIVFGRREPDLVDRAVGLVELGVKAVRTGKDARDIFDQIAARVSKIK